MGVNFSIQDLRVSMLSFSQTSHLISSSFQVYQGKRFELLEKNLTP
jgi:hypothetical protein